MLYIGAVLGTDRWLNPVHVVRMSDRQAAKNDDRSRTQYAKQPKPLGLRWYQENSREQVRDEVLRQGLIPNNAVAERPGVPTTSSKPRYALTADFAALFDPVLSDAEIAARSRRWLTENLDPTALARTRLSRRINRPASGAVLVTFPNGEVRQMAAGPSSEITRSLIEDFAPRFLGNPAVLWVSESGEKVVAQDNELAAKLGLKIDVKRNLPDVILVDVGTGRSDFLLVFVEVVASDGAMIPSRVNALASIALAAGFDRDKVAFVTAYSSRERSEFRRSVAALAWRSFAWFATEPDHVMQLHDGLESETKLGDLIRRASNRSARR